MIALLILATTLWLLEPGFTFLLHRLHCQVRVELLLLSLAAATSGSAIRLSSSP